MNIIWSADSSGIDASGNLTANNVSFTRGTFAGDITSTAVITGGTLQTAASGNNRFILDSNGLTYTASNTDTVLQNYATYNNSKWFVDNIITTNNKIATTYIRQYDALGNALDITSLTYDGSILSGSSRYFGTTAASFGGAVYFGATGDTASGAPGVTSYFVDISGNAKFNDITALGELTGSATIRGSDSFTTTAVNDTVTISGASINDYYFTQITIAAGIGTPTDIITVETTSAGFIARRPTGTTSGLTYNWFRIK